MLLNYNEKTKLNLSENVLSKYFLFFCIFLPQYMKKTGNFLLLTSQSFTLIQFANQTRDTITLKVEG